MAQIAKESRALAAIELEEAIRQAQRYTTGYNPSTRIINQKTNRVREKEDEFKRCHYAYCEKAKLEISGDEAMRYLREMSDKATDAIDECMVFVEDLERKEHEGDQQANEAALQEEQKHKVDVQYQRYLTEVAIDERIAKDLCQKVHTTVSEDDLSITNVVLMKTHLEALTKNDEVLKKSW